MENGFRVLWTDHALDELQSTFEYLEHKWTNKEVVKLALKIEHVVELISKNPYMFQESVEVRGIRQAVVMKHNTMYFRIIGETIEVLSFFSNRQNPSSKKL
ncbi:Plasmid stabilization system protein ParE [Algoriphagus locisalis]|uniref:Plasmid stabilization system protein ParE n=1 Tax=Algoriphagus locisalis TaxID=305507 RepID=A0A1I7BRX3_9BACT|nr:Plasmid stabilization system protein ParE [Algoriphagus locisalis]